MNSGEEGKLGKDALKVTNCQAAGLQLSAANCWTQTEEYQTGEVRFRWICGFCRTKKLGVGGRLAEWFRCLRGSCLHRESPVMSEQRLGEFVQTQGIHLATLILK